MPGLQFPYTDPRTGTPYPKAYLAVSDGRIQLNPLSAQFEQALYRDQDAAEAGLQPFEERKNVQLSQAEVSILRDQFALAVYQIFLARPEFAGAQIVGIPLPPAPVPPDAPTGVTAVAGNGEAFLTWDAPAGGKAAPSKYTITGTPGSVTMDVVAPTTSATVTGLTNGTDYTFTVTATNAYGSGPPSEPSASVRLIGPPGAPTGVAAVAGNAQADVSWSAPDSDGGSPITGYLVQSQPDGIIAGATPSATSATVGGLANGTTYVFTVTASNAVGSGPASLPSPGVTPAAPALPPAQAPRTARKARSRGRGT